MIVIVVLRRTTPHHATLNMRYSRLCACKIYSYVQGASSSSPSSPNMGGPALTASGNGVLFEHDENDATPNAPQTPNSGGGGAGPSLISPAKEKRKAFFRKVLALPPAACVRVRVTYKLCARTWLI